MKRVVIVGGGFAGLNCAKALAKVGDLDICLIDRRNYHLFQPLLYQVAMAGLSPADIASPIRSLLTQQDGVQVLQAEVRKVDTASGTLESNVGTHRYDYLVLASGAQHSYFGNNEWEEYAPGLKNLEQATEIRRRVLSAFERAECEPDPSRRRALLTFAVVGGGPTGVELAGAIGEMTRFTLARDFHNIDPKLTRIVLIESGPRVLASFDNSLASRATAELERLGVQVWTNSRVTRIDGSGVYVGEEHLASSTVIWGAGVQASPLGKELESQLDRSGRVHVQPDLSVPGHPRVFVVGDQAHFLPEGSERPLPGTATVAIQQGQHVARVIVADHGGRPRPAFRFRDRGQMATVGRRQALLQRGKLRSAGMFAWFMWLVIHIYFLSGSRNRLLVILQWSWSYLTFSRGARLITQRDWRSYPKAEPAPDEKTGDSRSVAARVAEDSGLTASHAASRAEPHPSPANAVEPAADAARAEEPRPSAAAPSASHPPTPRARAASATSLRASAAPRGPSPTTAGQPLEATARRSDEAPASAAPQQAPPKAQPPAPPERSTRPAAHRSGPPDSRIRGNRSRTSSCSGLREGARPPATTTVTTRPPPPPREQEPATALADLAAGCPASASSLAVAPPPTHRQQGSESMNRPKYLPKDFPEHAPLPPGAGWVRPTGEDDWEDTTEMVAPPAAAAPLLEADEPRGALEVAATQPAMGSFSPSPTHPVDPALAATLPAFEGRVGRGIHHDRAPAPRAVSQAAPRATAESQTRVTAQDGGALGMGMPVSLTPMAMADGRAPAASVAKKRPA